MNSVRTRPEVHGHRGCRGYLPENTIPAFLRAVELGVDALELDVVVTGDNQVLVSHEAWFASEICLKPDGSSISPAEEKAHNIYRLSYDQIRLYDCGFKPHPRFPSQKNLPAYKPLLSDVIDAVEAFVLKYNYPPIKYNIEIKSYPEGDGVYHPAPAQFASLVMGVLSSKSIQHKTMVQSFDARPLQYLYYEHKFEQLGLLTEDQMPVNEHLAQLGFLPFAYNPKYNLLTPGLIADLQYRDISIYTWTVNNVDNLADMLKFNLNGIITDYPEIVLNVIKNNFNRI